MPGEYNKKSVTNVQFSKKFVYLHRVSKAYAPGALCLCMDG